MFNALSDILSDVLQSVLTELGLLALPLVTQVITATTTCYTAYRALRHGLPALWRVARAGWDHALAWSRRPSRAAVEAAQLRDQFAQLARTQNETQRAVSALAEAWAPASRHHD